MNLSQVSNCYNEIYRSFEPTGRVNQLHYKYIFSCLANTNGRFHELYKQVKNYICTQILNTEGTQINLSPITLFYQIMYEVSNKMNRNSE
jgi:hypothetical protein